MHRRGVLVLRLDEEVHDMLARAERVREAWVNQFGTLDKSDKSMVACHIRNINALAGVIKGLHWVLGNEENPLS